MTIQARRYPIEVGGWCREMDGRLCQVIATEPIPGGQLYRVRYEDGDTAMRLPGFLQAVPSSEAP